MTLNRIEVEMLRIVSLPVTSTLLSWEKIKPQTPPDLDDRRDREMKRLGLMLAVLVSLLISSSVTAAPPSARTFVAVLTAEAEVPTCAAASNDARGVFVGHVTDESAGTVEWMLLANNLPGTTITAAHIHIAPVGTPGPVVQPLFTSPLPGDRVMETGSFTNPALLAALQANASNYYVNVHTNVCPAGAVRGQLGKQGP